MHTPQIDHVSAGCVVAYDAKTGDVLWMHEKIVEVIPGQEERPTGITEEECEQVRAEAAHVFRGRTVKALIMPEGFVLREHVRIAVDPDTNTPYEILDEPRSLADRFADFST